MDATRLDWAAERLEAMRSLLSDMQTLNNEEALKSREYSLAITKAEEAKLWLQELVVKYQEQC